MIDPDVAAQVAALASAAPVIPAEMKESAKSPRPPKVAKPKLNDAALKVDAKPVKAMSAKKVEKVMKDVGAAKAEKPAKAAAKKAALEKVPAGQTFEQPTGSGGLTDSQYIKASNAGTVPFDANKLQAAMRRMGYED